MPAALPKTVVVAEAVATEKQAEPKNSIATNSEAMNPQLYAFGKKLI